jgi:hypothetical protein
MAKSGEGATRIHRTSLFPRVFAIVFTAFGIVIAVALWGGAIAGTRDASWIELLFPLAFVAIGTLLTVGAFRSYIVLSQAEIVMQSPFGRRILPFVKIRGRRRYLDNGTDESPSLWCLKIQSNDDRFPAIAFAENSYKLDSDFLAWFHALPDLDELDKTRPKPSNFGLV